MLLLYLSKFPTFVKASNSLMLPLAFPFNAAVSCCAAATIVSSSETVGCVKYLCLNYTESDTLSALVAFAKSLLNIQW